MSKSEIMHSVFNVQVQAVQNDKETGGHFQPSIDELS